MRISADQTEVQTRVNGCKLGLYVEREVNVIGLNREHQWTLTKPLWEIAAFSATKAVY